MKAQPQPEVQQIRSWNSKSSLEVSKNILSSFFDSGLQLYMTLVFFVHYTGNEGTLRGRTTSISSIPKIDDNNFLRICFTNSSCKMYNYRRFFLMRT